MSDSEHPRAARSKAQRDHLRLAVTRMKGDHEAELAEFKELLAMSEAKFQEAERLHQTSLERLRLEAAMRKEEYEAEAKRAERKHKAALDFLSLNARSAFEWEDVLIKLKYPDGGKLEHARRFVLASKSPVFKQMFGNGISRRYDGFYTLDNYSAPVMRAVLKFCHDGRIEFTKEVRAEDVLTVARDYEINHLECVCVDELLENWMDLDSAEDTNSEAVDFAVFEFCCTGEIAFTEEITVQEVLKVACYRNFAKLEEICTKELLAKLQKDNLVEIFRLSKMCGSKRLEEEATKYVKENFDEAFPKMLPALFVDGTPDIHTMQLEPYALQHNSVDGTPDIHTMQLVPYPFQHNSNELPLSYNGELVINDM